MKRSIHILATLLLTACASDPAVFSGPGEGGEGGVFVLPGGGGAGGEAGSHEGGTQAGVGGNTGVGGETGTGGSGPAIGTQENPATSCQHILTTGSSLGNGFYWLRSDPQCENTQVYCDMTTDGGGWTLVSDAVSLPMSSIEIDYTYGCSAARTSSTEALLAQRDITLAVIGTEWATLPMPEQWKVLSPYMYEAEVLPTQVSVAGTVPVAANLVYGYASFGGSCDLLWNENEYGRICTPGIGAPSVFGFASGLADSCGVSTQDIGSMQPCSEHRRFTISVR